MQDTKNNINIIHKIDEKKLFSYFHTNIVKSKEIDLKSLTFILQLIICYRLLKFFSNLGRKLYIPKQTVRMAWQ